MPTCKDKNRGTWIAAFYYTDWTGERKKKYKRGFKSKKEAAEWERSFLERKAETLDMKFEDFVKVYTEDMKPKLRSVCLCTSRWPVIQAISKCL